MPATKSIKIYPTTYRRLRRVAKANRQTFAVVLDELSKQADSVHVNSEESTGSEMGRTEAVAAADESSSPTVDAADQLSLSPDAGALPSISAPVSPSYPGAAPSPDAAPFSQPAEGPAANSGTHGRVPLSSTEPSVFVESGDRAADRATDAETQRS